MKVYVGPPVVSCEFEKFGMGVTFNSEPIGEEKWFVFSQRGVSLRNCFCVKKGRQWTPPENFEEFLFEVEGLKVGILYGKELRMRKLLKKLRDIKIDLLLGYTEMERYGSHMLLANGWGAAQIVEAPTLLISHTKGDRAAYSLFKKENPLRNGVEFVYERYLFFEFGSSEKKFDKNSKWNNGIKGDKG